MRKRFFINCLIDSANQIRDKWSIKIMILLLLFKKVSYTFSFKDWILSQDYNNQLTTIAVCSMTKILALLVALCLIQATYNQCADGTFTLTPPFAGKGTCQVCLPICKTCTSATSCTTYVSQITGIDSATPPALLCAAQGALATGAAFGYNKAQDACDRCIDGCSQCAVDYNMCYSCKAGWDLDSTKGECIRATLGLAAVVLALSALTFLLLIITCICACKLS